MIDFQQHLPSYQQADHLASGDLLEPNTQEDQQKYAAGLGGAAQLNEQNHIPLSWLPQLQTTQSKAKFRYYMRNVFKDLGTRDNGLTKREFHIGAFLQPQLPQQSDVTRNDGHIIQGEDEKKEKQQLNEQSSPQTDNSKLVNKEDRLKEKAKLIEGENKCASSINRTPSQKSLSGFDAERGQQNVHTSPPVPQKNEGVMLKDGQREDYLAEYNKDEGGEEELKKEKSIALMSQLYHQHELGQNIHKSISNREINQIAGKLNEAASQAGANIQTQHKFLVHFETSQIQEIKELTANEEGFMQIMETIYLQQDEKIVRRLIFQMIDVAGLGVVSRDQVRTFLFHTLSFKKPCHGDMRTILEYIVANHQLHTSLQIEKQRSANGEEVIIQDRIQSHQQMSQHQFGKGGVDQLKDMNHPNNYGPFKSVQQDNIKTKAIEIILDQTFPQSSSSLNQPYLMKNHYIKGESGGGLSALGENLTLDEFLEVSGGGNTTLTNKTGFNEIFIDSCSAKQKMIPSDNAHDEGASPSKLKRKNTENLYRVIILYLRLIFPCAWKFEKLLNSDLQLQLKQNQQKWSVFQNQARIQVENSAQELILANRASGSGGCAGNGDVAGMSQMCLCCQGSCNSPKNFCQMAGCSPAQNEDIEINHQMQGEQQPKYYYGKLKDESPFSTPNQQQRTKASAICFQRFGIKSGGSREISPCEADQQQQKQQRSNAAARDGQNVGEQYQNITVGGFSSTVGRRNQREMQVQPNNIYSRDDGLEQYNHHGSPQQQFKAYVFHKKQQEQIDQEAREYSQQNEDSTQNRAAYQDYSRRGGPSGYQSPLKSQFQKKSGGVFAGGTELKTLSPSGAGGSGYQQYNQQLMGAATAGVAWGNSHHPTAGFSTFKKRKSPIGMDGKLMSNQSNNTGLPAAAVESQRRGVQIQLMKIQGPVNTNDDGDDLNFEAKRNMMLIIKRQRPSVGGAPSSAENCNEFQSVNRPLSGHGRMIPPTIVKAAGGGIGHSLQNQDMQQQNNNPNLQEYLQIVQPNTPNNKLPLLTISNFNDKPKSMNPALNCWPSSAIEGMKLPYHIVRHGPPQQDGSGALSKEHPEAFIISRQPHHNLPSNRNDQNHFSSNKRESNADLEIDEDSIREEQFPGADEISDESNSLGCISDERNGTDKTENTRPIIMDVRSNFRVLKDLSRSHRTESMNQFEHFQTEMQEEQKYQRNKTDPSRMYTDNQCQQYIPQGYSNMVEFHARPEWSDMTFKSGLYQRIKDQFEGCNQQFKQTPSQYENQLQKNMTKEVLQPTWYGGGMSQMQSRTNLDCYSNHHRSGCESPYNNMRSTVKNGGGNILQIRESKRMLPGPNTLGFAQIIPHQRNKSVFLECTDNGVFHPNVIGASGDAVNAMVVPGQGGLMGKLYAINSGCEFEKGAGIGFGVTGAGPSGRWLNQLAIKDCKQRIHSLAAGPTDLLMAMQYRISLNRINPSLLNAQYKQQQPFHIQEEKPSYSHLYQSILRHRLERREKKKKALDKNEGTSDQWAVYLQTVPPNEHQKILGKVQLLNLDLNGPDVVGYQQAKGNKMLFQHSLACCEFQIQQTTTQKTLDAGLPPASTSQQRKSLKSDGKGNNFENKFLDNNERHDIQDLLMPPNANGGGMTLEMKAILTIKIGPENKRVFYMRDYLQAQALVANFQARAQFYEDEVKEEDPKNRYPLANGTEKKSLLGSGAFGKVFKVIDKQTQKQMAMKRLSRKDIKGDQLLYIIQEIEILLLLSEEPHPGVLQTTDIFMDATYVYIVSELITGGPLQEWVLNDLNKVSISEKEKVTMDMLRPVIEALAYLHERGIAHRDIKLENVMLQKKEGDDENANNSHPILVDFGLSALFLGPEKSKQIVGSVAFMSPELVAGDAHTCQSDIWSIGIVFYVLLTSRFPFVAQTAEQTMENIRNKDANFQQPFWDHVSATGIDLVGKMLEKDPKKRITAKQILQHAAIIRSAK